MNWDTAQAQQFGHSTMISNMWYGLTEGEMSTMRRHLIEDHRKVSQSWHKFLQGELTLKRKRVVSCAEDDLCAMAMKRTEGSSGAFCSMHVPTGINSTHICSSEQKVFVIIEYSRFVNLFCHNSRPKYHHLATEQI